MHGELLVVDDLADAFVQRVLEGFSARPDDEFCMALTGGRTARACYERLASTAAEQINWWAVNVYWADECCVPDNHPDSHQLLGRQVLLERVGAANAVYPMRCEDGPEAYQLRLGELGKLDLVHLGLGDDGHTAGLFRDSAALEADPGQLVTLSEDASGRYPHRRMTLTYSGIARARLVLITVAGEAKRPVMEALVDGADLPASRIEADRVIWLVDGDAAPRRRSAGTVPG